MTPFLPTEVINNDSNSKKTRNKAEFKIQKKQMKKSKVMKNHIIFLYSLPIHITKNV